MLKTFAGFVFCLSFLLPPLSADTMDLSLSGPASVSQGSGFALDVDIANAPNSPGLAAYTVTLSYDPTLTLANSVEGTFLLDAGEGTYFSVTIGDGTSLPVGQIQITDLTAAGDATPDTSGELFELDFQPTTNAASYAFGFVPNNAANGFFNEQFVDSNANPVADSSILYNSASVQVTPSAVTAPEPVSWALVALGLTAVALCKFAGASPSKDGPRN